MGETWFPPWERVGRERRSLALGLLEAKVLVVEPVPELRALGLQVVAVLVVRRDLDRHLLDDRQAEALDARDLLRVVREDSNRREPEIGEDLVADPRERLLELLAAVAAERVEDVSGQTLGVDADEDILLALDVALDERDVVLAGQLLPEGDRNEVSVGRREADRSHALHQLLRAPAVLDQVFDRDHLELVARAVLDKVGYARHRPVVFHHLADDAGRIEACEAGEID